MSWESWRFICGAGWKVVAYLEGSSWRVEVRMRKWDKRGRRARIVRKPALCRRGVHRNDIGPSVHRFDPADRCDSNDLPAVARQDPSNVISVDTEGVTRSPQTEEYCSHAVGRGVFAASVEGAATCADAGVGQFCESVS